MHRSLRLLLGLITLTSSALAATPPILAKARAYLGSEEALGNVQSLHYVGSLEEAEDGKPAESYPIDMIFEKDFKQRLVLTRPNVIDITALDDFEAWHRTQDPQHPRVGNTVLYGKTYVEQLRAGAWENLSFFSDLAAVGGSISDDGMVDLDGRKAHKVTFTHEPGLAYVRFFDPESGKLLLTITDNGVQEIREEGEIESGGIRFPKKIINTIAAGEGKKRVVTINVDHITVNENFPESLFSVPLTMPNP